MLIEVKKGGKVYAHADTAEPPYPNSVLLEMLDAGYTPYVNGKRVTRTSLQPRKRGTERSKT